MTNELQHFTTEMKNSVNALELNTLKQKLDYDEIFKQIKTIEKSLRNVKSLVKCFRDIDETKKT